jgi:hypothetical protein
MPKSPLWLFDVNSRFIFQRFNLLLRLLSLLEPQIREDAQIACLSTFALLLLLFFQLNVFLVMFRILSPVKEEFDWRT